MENLDYKQDIIATRQGGLGSSDAKMALRLGKLILSGESKPQLNEGEKQRIAQMLGLAERKQFSTKATRMGDEIENEIFSLVKSQYPDAVSNPYYELSNNNLPFKVFGHIDYEVILPDRIIWIENKATKANFVKTMADYEAQLAWHYMLCEDKALSLGLKGVNAEIYLSHYQTEVTEEFNVDNWKMQIVPALSSNIEAIRKGLEYIGSLLDGFVYEEPECLYAENLPMETQQQVDIIANKILEMKRIEADIENFKANMCGLMAESGVKSVKHPLFSITLVPESQTTKFDSTKFKKEHKDLYDQYQSVVSKKAYVTIKAL